MKPIVNVGDIHPNLPTMVIDGRQYVPLDIIANDTFDDMIETKYHILKYNTGILTHIIDLNELIPGGSENPVTCDDVYWRYEITDNFNSFKHVIYTLSPRKKELKRIMREIYDDDLFLIIKESCIEQSATSQSEN